jgi:cytochrome c
MSRWPFLMLSLLGGSLVAGCSARGPEQARNTPANAPIAARMATADARRGGRLFGTCAACHTIGEGAGDRGGPNLHGVVGRTMGWGSERFSYTEVLRDKGGVWDADALDRWLANPQRFAPGTSMIFAGVPDGNDRADIIAYLAANSSGATQ